MVLLLHTFAGDPRSREAARGMAVELLATQAASQPSGQPATDPPSLSARHTEAEEAESSLHVLVGNLVWPEG